ncbi:urea ABC transporter ATP-binding subunit UrtE [Ectothiorhodospiraceae bacterium WFHF3C12]|nr:urea ABC transporter ATP-binding subunit UrtE [Ectothiorhodospiraceae bacterium WFHF3C12]
MLSFEAVHSYYGSSAVLQDISFEVDEGKLLAVVGRNGVGKTTLMRTVMGLTDRARGRIRLADTELQNHSTYERARSGVAYVPQGREIIGRFTVEENLRMGTFARRDGRREIPGLVYELFPVLEEMAQRRGGDLSGGQQQQLAIGRALAMEPRVLLLDEPTEGIQPNIVELIEDVVMRLNRDYGITVVLVEQNVPFARRAAHEFLMLDNGRIAAGGTIEGLTDELVDEYMTI